MGDLSDSFRLDEGALGNLTSAVQFGFIIGTLIFALLSIADRFSPSRVFFVCGILGALFNLGIIWDGNSYASLLAFRFFTGFFLAGIYPVGMKIAADYYQAGLGKSLGYLVGALVLGTAFPHLLQDLKGDYPWPTVLISTSILASLGGIFMILLVPDGPHRKASQKLDLSAIPKVFRDAPFRSAAWGYFGHMWELYTFWAFCPILLNLYQEYHPLAELNVPLWSFLIIAVGSLACVFGGYLAENQGPKKVARVALMISGLCCVLAPFAFQLSLVPLFLAFLLIWGMSVIADSPMLSTLVAQNAPAEFKGTALTIVNSIGFAITVISIQSLTLLYTHTPSPYALLILAIGPLLGWRALR